MDKSLQVVEQKEVLFYDDRVVAVRAEDGKVYVPIRPFCDLLGIDPASQRRRIYRDPVLSEVSLTCDVVTTSQGQAEQRRLMRAFLTPDQASQISQAVKAVAMQLSKQTGRNEYGGVYGELYRKFGITSYKLLPSHKFDEAMRWLSGWYKELTDGADVPF